MNGEEVKRTLDNKGVCGDSGEDTLQSMISEFYSRRMLSIVIMVWTTGIVFMAAAVFSAVRFFQSEQTRELILFSTIFITCMVMMAIIKTFAWQIIHRNSIKKEIQRLELQIMEVAALLKENRG